MTNFQDASCEKCKFYIGSSEGVCCRYPPQVVLTDFKPLSYFPTVTHHNKCGEFVEEK